MRRTPLYTPFPLILTLKNKNRFVRKSLFLTLDIGFTKVVRYPVLIADEAEGETMHFKSHKILHNIVLLKQFTTAFVFAF